MSNEYSVVFTGKIIDGLDIDLVKNNIVAKTKLTAEQVSKLFEKAPRVIKKCNTQEEADKLITAFKSCGAITEIEGQVECLSELDLPGESEDENKSEKSTGAIGGIGNWVAPAIFIIGVILYYLVSGTATNSDKPVSAIAPKSALEKSIELAEIHCANEKTFIPAVCLSSGGIDQFHRDFDPLAQLIRKGNFAYYQYYKDGTCYINIEIEGTVRGDSYYKKFNCKPGLPLEILSQ